MAKQLRDSLGAVGRSLTTIRSETSPQSATESVQNALSAKVGSRLTPELLTKQLERLEANWGAPKDRTAGQMVVMTREWFSQLERFGSKTVTDAFTHVIGNHEYQWAGVFPKILGFCTRDDREWREVVDAQVKALPPPAPEKFERDGRTREEEIEFRTRQVEEMKRRAGFKSAADIEAEEIAARPKKEIPPAMEASEALKSTKLVRNLLAKQGRAPDGPANQTTSPPAGVGLFDDTEHGPN